jgi:hypothetical protein
MHNTVFNPAWVVCILSSVAFHIFFLLFGRQRRTSETQAVLNTNVVAHALEKDETQITYHTDNPADNSMGTISNFLR